MKLYFMVRNYQDKKREKEKKKKRSKDKKRQKVRVRNEDDYVMEIMDRTPTPSSGMFGGKSSSHNIKQEIKVIFNQIHELLLLVVQTNS